MSKLGRKWVTAAAVAVPFTAILGCGSGGDGSIALMDLPGRAIDAFCDAEVQCGRFPDKGTCAAVSRSGLTQLTVSVTTGKTKYDGNAAANCLAAVARVLGSCSIAAFAGGDEPQSCKDTFQGTLADGSACFANEECVSASCDFTNCSTQGTCCAGTCAAAAPSAIALGGNCGQIDAQCATGGFCDHSTLPPTCIERVALGQACTSFDSCVAGALCSGDPGTGSTCRKPAADGQPCDGSRVGCDSVAAFCDPITTKCIPKTKVGGACPNGTECVDYARCEPSTMTCVAKGVLDAACSTFSDCIDGLECTAAGRCQRFPTPDLSCS